MNKRKSNKANKKVYFCLIILIIMFCLVFHINLGIYSSVEANNEHVIRADIIAEGVSINAGLIFIPEPIDDLSALEEIINAQISNYSGKWQVYVKNLKTNMYVSINSKPVKAASIIKLFNMMAFYDYIDKNNLIITEKQKDLVSNMIIYSSNEASNSVVEIMGNGNFLSGAKYVTTYCKENGYNDTLEEQRLYDTVPAGAVMTGNNRISVADCGKALEDLYKMVCVNEEYSKEMLELLLAQYYNDKIPENLPEDIAVAHKTGQTSDIDADVRNSI